MKMKSAAIGSLLTLLVFATAFVTGCATAPPVDWGSRVGHYTYAQAVNELGPPNRQIRLSNGTTEFRWFPQSAAGNTGANPTGIKYNGMNNGFSDEPDISPGFNNRYLQLTFDARGVLTDWSEH